MLGAWTSPLHDPQSKKILLYGASAALLLEIFRDETIEPFQEYMSTHKPLGKLSQIGNYAGMLVPNLLYAGYMAYDWKSTGSLKSKSSMQNMLEATFYAGVTTQMLKYLTNEARPTASNSPSFPSGHTTTAFAFATTVALENPEWKYWAYGLATFVGFSRINDNRHYLHDVIMGAAVGSAYAVSIYNRSQEEQTAYVLSPVFMPDYFGYRFTVNL